MAHLNAAFQAGLEGGEEVRVRRGSGREYIMVISLTWVNQEFFTSFCRMYMPCFHRMFEGPRLAIMRSRPSCLMWRMAEAGRVPDKKYMTGAGVRGYSRWSCSSVTFWWEWRLEISEGERRRVARPL